MVLALPSPSLRQAVHGRRLVPALVTAEVWRSGSRVRSPVR